MPDSPNLPSRPIDRSALERVLARAAELQAASGETPEVISEERLLEIGKEVGLSPAHLRQALAEERTRLVVAPAGGAAGPFGPGRVHVSRTVRGRPEAVLAQIDRWMQRDECLQVRRRHGERITWEPRRDLIGNIRRGFNIGGRGYALSRADEVGATVVPVDEERVLVRLDADLGGTRRSAVGWSGAAAGLGAVSGAGVVTVAAFAGGVMLLAGAVGVAWAGLGAAAGYGIARSQRRLAERVLLALEQVLDRVEHPERGPGAPSLLGELLGKPRG